MAKSLGSAVKVPAVCALVCYLSVNLALAAANQYRLRGQSRPEERGATYQACDSAVSQFRSQAHGSPMVLMGSSVVMAPVWSVDRELSSTVIDVYHYHRSVYLEQLINQGGVTGRQVFSLALPGAMVSDVFLLADKLFLDKSTPAVVVYGLTPRDLMDDLLTGETRTAVFEELMTISDVPSLGNLYLSSWSEKADFVLNNLLFLYGKRWRYQNNLASFYHRTVEQLCPARAGDAAELESAAERRFLLEQDRAVAWKRNLEEYRARYRHFNRQQFDKQMRFLKDLITLCRRRGITLALVNMPLTRDNLSLMPQGLYDDYLNGIMHLASTYGCPFMDLQKSLHCDTTCFYDTVHLNARGGERLLSYLGRWMASVPSRLN